MTNQGQSTQLYAVLNELVHCAFCGTNMVLDGTVYRCPNKGTRTGSICRSASIDADRLFHQLMTTLVERALTPDELTIMVERIQKFANDEMDIQREHLNISEAQIEELNRQKLDLLTEVEYGKSKYTEVTDSLASIEAAIAGFAVQSSFSQEELEQLQFVSSADAIQFVAKDISTYTEYADPEIARRLVQGFIKGIQIGVSSGTVTYTHSIPGHRSGELVTSETFVIPPA